MASLTQEGITFGDGTSQNTASTGFPSGTVMLFVQSAAPTGWTKSTAHNDKALRVVSGSVSSGGSVAFSSAFASRSLSIDGTTLSTTQIPSHSHNILLNNGSTNTTANRPYYTNYANATLNYSSDAAGGGGSHTHSGSLNMAVQYVDVIICTKN